MQNEEVISSTEVLAGLLSGSAQTKTSAYVKPISFRITVSNLARVDACADKVNKSRNAMLNLLVGVGLDEVLSRVEQGAIEEIMSREIHAIQKLRDEGFGDVVEE